MKRLILLTLILFPILTACQGDHWPAEPLGRDNYAEENFDRPWNLIFFEEYELAVENGEDWVKSPIEVALRFLGYPNPDNLPPSRVFAYYIESTNKAVVVVRSGIEMDDSIYMTENRIDLFIEEGVWMIEWAGFRQRCRRPTISDWTTELCP